MCASSLLVTQSTTEGSDSDIEQKLSLTHTVTRYIKCTNQMSAVERELSAAVTVTATPPPNSSSSSSSKDRHEEKEKGQEQRTDGAKVSVEAEMGSRCPSADTRAMLV